MDNRQLMGDKIMNKEEVLVKFYGGRLDSILQRVDCALGDLNLLSNDVGNVVEMLGELQGEIGERGENIAQALDLNRKAKGWL